MLQCNFCSAAIRKLQCNFRFRWWHVAGVGFRGVGFRTCWRPFLVLVSQTPRPRGRGRPLLLMILGGGVGGCWGVAFVKARQINSPGFSFTFAFVGDRFLSSAGAGGNCARSMKLPDPSPVLDKNRAPVGPEILSSTGAGVWKEAPMAFPDSSSVLDKFQSAISEWWCWARTCHNSRPYLRKLIKIPEIFFRFHFRN